MKIQLKSVLENELTSAAITARGKSLLFSHFLTSFFFHIFDRRRDKMSG